MKLVSTRIVTKHVPELAAFYEKITQIITVGTDTYIEIRTPGSVLAILGLWNPLTSLGLPIDAIP